LPYTTLNVNDRIKNQHSIRKKGVMELDNEFAVRLTELRKNAGMSQKDVAAVLGVSQALLSHYEKGIRECGLDFLKRVADYYEVSCDYLLGKSSFKSWQSEVNLQERDMPEDENFNIQTVTRVASLIRETLKNENTVGSDRLLRFYTLSLYRMIITAVKAGYLPKNWLGENGFIGSSLYTSYLSAFSVWLLDIEKNPEEFPVEETPLYLKTFISEMDSYVHSQIASIYLNAEQ